MLRRNQRTCHSWKAAARCFMNFGLSLTSSILWFKLVHDMLLPRFTVMPCPDASSQSRCKLSAPPAIQCWDPDQTADPNRTLQSQRRNGCGSCLIADQCADSSLAGSGGTSLCAGHLRGKMMQLQPKADASTIRVIRGTVSQQYEVPTIRTDLCWRNLDGIEALPSQFRENPTFSRHQAEAVFFGVGLQRLRRDSGSYCPKIDGTKK